MLDIVKQRRRNPVRLRRHEDGRPGHARGTVLGRLCKDFDWQCDFGHTLAHQLAAARPRGQQCERNQADDKREPTPLRHLHQVRCEIRPVDDQEQQHDRHGEPPLPFPHADQQNAHQERVDRDRAGHCNAVSAGQIGRVLEGQHEDDDGDHQRPVDDRDIDLTRFGFARMPNGEARHEAQLHRLMRDRERAGDHCLAGDERGDRGEQHQRQPPFLAGEQEERITHHLGGLLGRETGNHRALPEIIEQQARHDEAEPGKAHRAPAEMAHIGIQRFRSRHGQHHRAQCEERDEPVTDEKLDRVIRVERPQDVGILGNLVQAETCDYGEIDDHHRGEKRAHFCRPAALQNEQKDQQNKRNRNDQRVQPVIDDGQTFHRRQHRNRRRNHAVPVEQRCRENAKQDHQPAISRLPDMPGQQGNECEAAPLPLVIGAHQDRDVLDRDDQQHRPENKADDTQDVQPIDGDRVIVGLAESLAKGVEWTGADIAEHDTDGADGERRTGRALLAAMPVDKRFFGRCRSNVAHRLVSNLTRKRLDAVTCGLDPTAKARASSTGVGYRQSRRPPVDYGRSIIPRRASIA